MISQKIVWMLACTVAVCTRAVIECICRLGRRRATAGGERSDGCRGGWGPGSDGDTERGPWRMIFVDCLSLSPLTSLVAPLSVCLSLCLSLSSPFRIYISLPLHTRQFFLRPNHSNRPPGSSRLASQNSCKTRTHIAHQPQSSGERDRRPSYRTEPAPDHPHNLAR